MTKLGVVTFGAGFGPERFERADALATRAESAGFDSVWVSELYNRSATVPMATISRATSRVEIGTNIAYGVGRTPLMWAAEARDPACTGRNPGILATSSAVALAASG